MKAKQKIIDPEVKRPVLAPSAPTSCPVCGREVDIYTTGSSSNLYCSTLRVGTPASIENHTYSFNKNYVERSPIDSNPYSADVIDQKWKYPAVKPWLTISSVHIIRSNGNNNAHVAVSLIMGERQTNVEIIKDSRTTEEVMKLYRKYKRFGIMT